MGKVDDFKRLRNAAVTRAKSPKTVAEDLNKIKGAVVAAAKDPQALSKATEVGKEILSGAIDEAGLRKRSGEISKIRVAKALATPALSGRTILKGAARVAMRQAGDQWRDSSPPESTQTCGPKEAIPPPSGQIQTIKEIDPGHR